MSDNHAAAQSISPKVTVDARFDKAEAKVKIECNSWPRVIGLTAAPGRIDAAETTSLALSILDADGDP